MSLKITFRRAKNLIDSLNPNHRGWWSLSLDHFVKVGFKNFSPQVYLRDPFGRWFQILQNPITAISVSLTIFSNFFYPLSIPVLATIFSVIGLFQFTSFHVLEPDDLRLEHRIEEVEIEVHEKESESED